MIIYRLFYNISNGVLLQSIYEIVQHTPTCMYLVLMLLLFNQIYLSGLAIITMYYDSSHPMHCSRLTVCTPSYWICWEGGEVIQIFPQFPIQFFLFFWYSYRRGDIHIKTCGKFHRNSFSNHSFLRQSFNKLLFLKREHISLWLFF